MEIKVRKLNAGAVKTIDELAKQKGMKREPYLRLLIENHLASASLQDLKDDLAIEQKRTNMLLQKNLKMTEEIYDALFAKDEGGMFL